MEWDSKSVIETGLLFGLAAGMYLYSRKVWSPQATATGTVDFSEIEKIDKTWAAVEERGSSRRAK